MPSRPADIKRIRVLIADDHPVVRSGVRTALSDARDIEIIGEATDGLEAERLALQLNPDVLIMDLSMPERDGLRSLLSIKRGLPAVSVLILTVSEEEDDLVRAIRYGADGFLLKKCDLQEILEATRKVAGGEAVLSPQFTKRVMSDLMAGGESRSLSAREQEVLELVGTGLTNPEIAERLHINQQTVGTYLHRLLTKLHLKSRAETMAYALHGSPPTTPVAQRGTRNREQGTRPA